MRQAIREELQRYRPHGRCPHLQVILDIKTLGKRGKFKAYEDLISVFHGKRAVHLVVLYLVVGPWRVPWSLRLYRGKEQPSAAPLKASTIVWWGRHRWQIESFFKTAKHRFGLHRFSQQTLLGMYRWLVSLVAFILAHWDYLSMDTDALPDWAAAATVVGMK